MYVLSGFRAFVPVLILYCFSPAILLSVYLFSVLFLCIFVLSLCWFYYKRSELLIQHVNKYPLNRIIIILLYYRYYYYYSIWMSLVTCLFFPVLPLNQQWSPPLTLQALHCSTFRIVCDVPSIAVFCSESIECFPGTASRLFLKLLVTIPVAPIITGIIVHFRFHIHRISIHKHLYLNFIPLPFAQHFCLWVLPHLSACMFVPFCF